MFCLGHSLLSLASPHGQFSRSLTPQHLFSSLPSVSYLRHQAQEQKLRPSLFRPVPLTPAFLCVCVVCLHSLAAPVRSTLTACKDTAETRESIGSLVSNMTDQPGLLLVDIWGDYLQQERSCSETLKYFMMQTTVPCIFVILRSG